MRYQKTQPTTQKLSQSREASLYWKLKHYIDFLPFSFFFPLPFFKLLQSLNCYKVQSKMSTLWSPSATGPCAEGLLQPLHWAQHRSEHLYPPVGTYIKSAPKPAVKHDSQWGSVPSVKTLSAQASASCTQGTLASEGSWSARAEAGDLSPHPQLYFPHSATLVPAQLYGCMVSQTKQPKVSY